MNDASVKVPEPRAGLTLVLGIHNHQPVGNFGFVFERAARECYRKVVAAIAAHPAVRFAFHFSGPLLEWLADNDSALIADVRALVARGQVEVLGSGIGEPVLALLPPRDLATQVAAMNDLCVELFDTSPRGIWLTERVWEPSLPAALAPLGIEYTFVDDHHFHGAGFAPGTVHGFHSASRHGRAVRVFPISERLRYLIPFAPLPEVFAVLEDLARAAARQGGMVLTCMDDGEKFGLWPGTAEWVFDEGWLEGFLAGLERRSRGLDADPEVAITTALPGAVVDARDTEGRAALPTASYRELSEWALPAPAIRRRERLAGLLTEEARELLGGGFFDQFQAKYDEVARLAGRMLRTSALLSAAEDEARRKGICDLPADLSRARHLLHQAQCNDAYWHGLFGGLYLPFLRQGIRARLIEAERLIDPGSSGVAWERVDVDLDAEEEVLVSTPEVLLAVRPRDGGCLSLLEDRTLGLALDDVLTRREEAYHDRVAGAGAEVDPEGGPRTIHHITRSKSSGLERYLLYDASWRLSGRLRVLDGPPEPERLRRGDQDDLGRLATARFELRGVTRTAGGVEVELGAAGLDLGGGIAADVVKRFLVPSTGMGFELEVALEHQRGPAPPASHYLDVELALTLDAIDEQRGIAAGDGEPRPVTSCGKERGRSLQLVDRARKAAFAAELDREGALAFHPIETISASEDGFERIFQGTSLHLALPLRELVAGRGMVLGFCRVEQR